MESLLVEQSFSPKKPIKNSKRKTLQQFNNPYNLHQNRFYNNYNNNISRQVSLSSQNYAPQSQVMMHEFDHMMMHHMHGGFFLNNHHAPYNNDNHHMHGSKSLPPISLGQLQQPPLLPLPTVSRPAFRSLPPHQPPQSLSPPIVPRKTPAKTNKTPSKKENKKSNITDLNNDKNLVKFNSVKPTKKSNGDKVIGPMKEIIGPDPETLAKDLTQMLLTDLDSWSVFNLAPPPSSLPLPKFYIRQIQKQQPLPLKLSCNAEVAADVSHGGASDNLRKLLKVR